MTNESPIIEPHDALLVVDVQRDFLPGGALAVPDGDAVIPVLNTALEAFALAQRPVFATRDWHPPDHVSFRDQGGPWPVHCVAGTPGAAFAPELRLSADTIIISKATDPRREAYSGFDGTRLAEELRARGIRRLWVGGLATDYCVRATVEDALRGGWDVLLMVDAVRAVDREPGDGRRALEAMQKMGAQCVSGSPRRLPSA